MHCLILATFAEMASRLRIGNSVTQCKEIIKSKRKQGRNIMPMLLFCVRSSKNSIVCGFTRHDGH